MNTRPRPEGFDYSKPDEEEARCPVCNPSGMNRTGLQFAGWVGSSSTCGYGVKCRGGCLNGIVGPWLREHAGAAA